MSNINIDPKEIAAAESEAACIIDPGKYTHHFKIPFTFISGTEQKSVTELTFEFDRLTGKDSLDVEAELQALGRPVVVAEMSGNYLIRMAARACTEKIGADSLIGLPLPDFNKIRTKVRSFLLHTGS